MDVYRYLLNLLNRKMLINGCCFEIFIMDSINFILGGDMLRLAVDSQTAERFTNLPKVCLIFFPDDFMCLNLNGYVLE